MLYQLHKKHTCNFNISILLESIVTLEGNFNLVTVQEITPFLLMMCVCDRLNRLNGTYFSNNKPNQNY